MNGTVPKFRQDLGRSSLLSPNVTAQFEARSLDDARFETDSATSFSSLIFRGRGEREGRGVG